MSDSVWPHRQQPIRLPRPWDSPGKKTGVGCHCLLQCMKVKSESEVAQSCPTLSDPMDCILPGSSVHGFSRQEYWSGVPLPSPIYIYIYICAYIYILFRFFSIIGYYNTLNIVPCTAQQVLVVCFVYSSVSVSSILLMYPSPPFLFGLFSMSVSLFLFCK